MNIKDILNESEIRQVTARSDLQAAWIVLSDWLIIAGCFAITASYPNPITILLAIIVLGGRQMGLGVIVHETGHRTLFRSPAMNDFVGRWLGGYPIFSDKEGYMKVHLRHHQSAGTEDDPDLNNYRAYPVSQKSLKRKIWRDLSGQIGWRRIKSIARGLARMSELPPERRQWMQRSLGVNLALLAVLAAAGHAWLYILWVLAFMTSHMLIVRIRQISEHAAVPDLFDLDPRMNTRTIYLSWWERFLVPHGVNYHLEHHMLASVPIYRLPLLHHLLLKKGFYKDTDFLHGYVNLLKSVTVPG